MNTISTVLTVPGIHCAGCMARIENGLAALPGVDTARVNLTKRQVSVVHNTTMAIPDLIQHLELLGYESQQRQAGAIDDNSAVKPLLAPLAVAAFATMNVMLLSVSVWAGASGETRELFYWLSAMIAVPAVAWSGRVFFVSAWRALRVGTTNMDVPISLAVLLATSLSLYETATHGAEAWFDGTLMLMLFLLAGRALDAMMKDRARAGVDALLRQAAGDAMVVNDDGTLIRLTADKLVPGMVMRLASGERLVADGILITGNSHFDRSLVTGESAPVPAGLGDEVLAGTLNLGAPVDVRVTAAGGDTSLAEIARLMDASGQRRGTYVRIADRASQLYAPVVHSAAAISFVGWMLAGAGWHHALVIAIAVLLITCPCALGLAVPIAQVVASSSLMKMGVMVKDGSALERMASVKRVLIDKTGTLTMGRPLPDLVALRALSADAAGVALALASHSRHPLSRALVATLRDAGVRLAVLQNVVEVPGEGVRALWRVEGQFLPVALRRPDPLLSGTGTGTGMVAALDIKGHPALLIPFADRLRPDWREALDALKTLGLTTSILSGDHQRAVDDIAQLMGLSAEAEATPAAKQQAIARAQADGAKVLMVGDGLNDGPALAMADASIAPGSASDVGRQAADCVFLGDSLLALPRTIFMAQRTMRVVKQNFTLAILYNVLAVPLAMAGKVTPLVAAIAMSASSLVVITNSLRLGFGGDIKK